MNKFKTFIPRLPAICIIAAALALGQIACAATGSKSSPHTLAHEKFDKMDTNKDGVVVLEEFRSAYPAMNNNAFAVIDKNASNGIERAEWFDFMQDHGKSAMGQMQQRGAPMNNIPGDPLIPPPDSADLPLVRPPNDVNGLP